MSERPKEADCKSAGLRLRRFKSFSRHVTPHVGRDTQRLYNPAPLAQSVERFHGKEEVFGSTPEGGSATQGREGWLGNGSDEALKAVRPTWSEASGGGVAQLVRALDS